MGHIGTGCAFHEVRLLDVRSDGRQSFLKFIIYRSLELCLHEVTKCQLFVGLLGERRGWRPLTYSVSDSSDEFAWLTSHPPGASVTELEIEQFALQDVDKAKGRCFFYFREKLAE